MSLNRFDLNLLHGLDALLTELNVTRAARRQYVSQQAMSGTLHRLRDHFGDELLMRVGRRMELTPLAKSLIAPVREALFAANFVLDVPLMFDPKTTRCEFRMAISDYASFVLLPPLMKRLCDAAPGIACNIQPLTEDCFDRLERGDLDFCLSPSEERPHEGYRRSDNIRSSPMFDDDFVCVVDAANSAVGDSLPIELYRRLPHTCARFGLGLVTLIERAWADAKLDLIVAATAPTFSGLIFMIPGTPLIATTQRKLAEALAPGQNLRILACPIVVSRLQEELSWHRRSESDPSHSYLRGLIAEVSGALEQTTALTSQDCDSQP